MKLTLLGWSWVRDTWQLTVHPVLSFFEWSMGQFTEVCGRSVCSDIRASLLRICKLSLFNFYPPPPLYPIPHPRSVSAKEAVETGRLMSALGGGLSYVSFCVFLYICLCVRSEGGGGVKWNKFRWRILEIWGFVIVVSHQIWFWASFFFINFLTFPFLILTFPGGSAVLPSLCKALKRGLLE